MASGVNSGQERWLITCLCQQWSSDGYSKAGPVIREAGKCLWGKGVKDLVSPPLLGETSWRPLSGCPLNRWGQAAGSSRRGDWVAHRGQKEGSPAHPRDGACPGQGAKQAAPCSWFMVPGAGLPREKTARSLRSRRLKMLEDWNDLPLISDPFIGLEAIVGLNGSVCLRDWKKLWWWRLFPNPFLCILVLREVFFLTRL